MLSPYELVEKKLGRAASRAIADFSMIEEGDRLLVAVSGGKDSYTMLHLLRSLQRKAPIRFELRVVNVDQGHPGYPGTSLARVHGTRGIRLHDDRGGYLLDRHGEDPEGQDVLLALLAPSPRHPLPGRAGARLQQNRPRPSPGRRAPDALSQPFVRGSARRDAAAPGGRRRVRSSSSGRSSTAPRKTFARSRIWRSFRFCRATCAVRRSTSSAKRWRGSSISSSANTPAPRR